MLISDDGYFPFFPFYVIFIDRAERGKFFGVDPVWTLKKCAMLKNCTTLIQFQPRLELCDAYLRRRQLFSDEYLTLVSNGETSLHRPRDDRLSA